MMNLSKKDIEKIKERYINRYQQFGYSPKTLGWDKGKQDIRFNVLTSQSDLTDKLILDIGCGFGDLNLILKKKFKNYNYTGIDVVNELIEKGKEIYDQENIKFLNGDFLKFDFNVRFDYAIASGLFNFKIKNENNYTFIESVIEKALTICNEGLAFDFLSDKVDFKYEHTFHSSPEKILEIGYKYSRNIVLRNDYMPFEFSIFIFKDDSFKIETTVFNLYEKFNNC